MSTLYGTIIVACLDNVFSFSTIAEWFELKLIKFIFTVSVLGFLFLNVFVLNCVNHTGTGPSRECLRVVDLATVVTPFTICQASSWFLLLSAVTASLFGDNCVTCLLFAPKPIFFVCNCIKVSWIVKVAYSCCLDSLILYSFCPC